MTPFRHHSFCTIHTYTHTYIILFISIYIEYTSSSTFRPATSPFREITSHRVFRALPPGVPRWPAAVTHAGVLSAAAATSPTWLSSRCSLLTTSACQAATGSGRGPTGADIGSRYDALVLPPLAPYSSLNCTEGVAYTGTITCSISRGVRAPREVLIWYKFETKLSKLFVCHSRICRSST